MQGSAQENGVAGNLGSAAYLYTRQGAYKHEDLHRLDALPRTAGDVLWVALNDPTPELIQQVCAQLSISEYVQQSMQEKHRRPKLISLESIAFMAVMTVALKV